MSFEEAETVFGDLLAKIFDDEEHSIEVETRWNCRAFDKKPAFDNQLYRKSQRNYYHNQRERNNAEGEEEIRK